MDLTRLSESLCLKVSQISMQAVQDDIRREKSVLEQEVSQTQEEMKAVQRREERLLQDIQPLHRTLQVRFLIL